MSFNKPTLVLDRSKCIANINRMATKARELNVDFRPHFKTHQSLEIGRWFKDFGVDKIAVSSVSMADYFSSEWDDITVAFPVNILEIEKINALASKIKLNLLVENLEGVQFLAQHLKAAVNVFIKIDVGTNRTGIHPENSILIDALVAAIATANLISFSGFLAHAGHTYACRTKNCIVAINNQACELLFKLKDRYKNDHPQLVNSLGDTPSCSLANKFKGIDEIRPGNFVFFDYMQTQIGSNAVNDIAIAMACPITAIHPEREELVIYGGSVHFSLNPFKDNTGITHYGAVVKAKGSGWGAIVPNMYIKKLSQEHGIVNFPKDKHQDYKLGDVLYVLPIHSCLTANLMRSYTTLEGLKLINFGSL